MREGGCHQHRWWWPFEKTGHAKSVTNPVTYRAEFDFVCASADVKSRSRCVGATLAKIKKAQTLAPAEIGRIANFSQNPKISPLHFSPSLGETNFQPIISRSPFILHSFRPFSRAFSCARSPNLAECNFRRIKVDVADVETPSQLVNQVGGGGGEESVNFWYVKKFEACPCPP